ncbi:uncharacterized protein MYCFIDRAFT_171287 [Pseudocercospora fijiensis CIRAD86]|uniref:Uncharacterized protein n=1 Tax=Pseudocercospora fijiensis (strain CIRAD86) TaxID=383855 RepID=M2Z6G1_PSEFD|nr:uncharacterized protein MYCFIDRAFT_171287 [Pseudocercospora fijiensis CIRAD86]EME85355.1 hypothetical protein MYCFIDRAFT_171287 [Pseudocercospora fijiensis CIRAD86]
MTYQRKRRCCRLDQHRLYRLFYSLTFCATNLLLPPSKRKTGLSANLPSTAMIVGWHGILNPGVYKISARVYTRIQYCSDYRNADFCKLSSIELIRLGIRACILFVTNQRNLFGATRLFAEALLQQTPLSETFFGTGVTKPRQSRYGKPILGLNGKDQSKGATSVMRMHTSIFLASATITMSRKSGIPVPGPRKSGGSGRSTPSNASLAGSRRSSTTLKTPMPNRSSLPISSRTPASMAPNPTRPSKDSRLSQSPAIRLQPPTKSSKPKPSSMSKSKSPAIQNKNHRHSQAAVSTPINKFPPIPNSQPKTPNAPPKQLQTPNSPPPTPSPFISVQVAEPCIQGALTHRLQPCGHKILTHTPTPCGKNCARDFKAELSRFALRKITTQKFVCAACVHIHLRRYREGREEATKSGLEASQATMGDLISEEWVRERERYEESVLRNDLERLRKRLEVLGRECWMIPGEPVFEEVKEEEGEGELGRKILFQSSKPARSAGEGEDEAVVGSGGVGC